MELYKMSTHFFQAQGVKWQKSGVEIVDVLCNCA